MGRGMAGCLLRAGHDVTVWNRTSERSQPLLAAGATAAGSPAELAATCDITMVCVSDTPDVEDVALGDNGLIQGLGAGKLVVDHSTISASATRRFVRCSEGGWCGLGRRTCQRRQRRGGAGHSFDYGRRRRGEPATGHAVPRGLRGQHYPRRTHRRRDKWPSWSTRCWS